MHLALRFDYSALGIETRIVVQQKTGEIRERAKRAVEDVIQIGERLIEVKARLGHGLFGSWLEAEFGWSDRQARNYMHVAEAFKTEIISDLPIDLTTLYALAAPSVPEAAREEVIQLARNGVEIDKEIVQQAKAKHVPASTRATNRPLTRPSRPVEDDTPAYEDESQEEPDEETNDLSEDAPPAPAPTSWPKTMTYSREPAIDSIVVNSVVAHPDSNPSPSTIAHVKEDQSELWQDNPEGPEEEEAHSAEWEARWLKFWASLSNFLVSLPRRGGVVHLTRNWPRKQVDAAIVRLEDLGKTALRCASELRESRR